MNYIPYLIRTRIVEVVTGTAEDHFNDPYFALSNEEDRQELQQELRRRTLIEYQNGLEGRNGQDF